MSAYIKEVEVGSPAERAGIVSGDELVSINGHKIRDVLDYKLETLCEYYDIIIPMKHRATADAIATGKLFLKLIEEKQR